MPISPRPPSAMKTSSSPPFGPRAGLFAFSLIARCLCSCWGNECNIAVGDCFNFAADVRQQRAGRPLVPDTWLRTGRTLFGCVMASPSGPARSIQACADVCEISAAVPARNPSVALIGEAVENSRPRVTLMPFWASDAAARPRSPGHVATFKPKPITARKPGCLKAWLPARRRRLDQYSSSLRSANQQIIGPFETKTD